jgi:hypothetical protein
MGKNVEEVFLAFVVRIDENLSQKRVILVVCVFQYCRFLEIRNAFGLAASGVIFVSLWW